MGWYTGRSESLHQLGYSEYQDYLMSPLWRSIRKNVMRRCNRVCEACQSEKATQVHHRDYLIGTMDGGNLESLVALCEDCHRQSEYDESNRKVSPEQANLRLEAIIANYRTGKFVATTNVVQRTIHAKKSKKETRREQRKAEAKSRRKEMKRFRIKHKEDKEKSAKQLEEFRKNKTFYRV